MLYPYNQGDFLVSEYSAVMKYGDISEWLKENTTEEPSDKVVETGEMTAEVKPIESNPEEVEVTEPNPEEVTEAPSKQLKHARGIISLK